MISYFSTNPHHILRWLPGCLIFFFSTCSSKSNYHSLIPNKSDSAATSQKNERAFAKIAIVKKTIRSGDLVVRTGNDFTSESLRNLNQRDQTYSHCGIASIEHDSLFVYHALGGDWNPNQKIRRDPLEVFAEPINNLGMGIYRFDLANNETASLMVTVKKLYAMGIMFDMEFDLESNDHMYCAEFVYKSYVMGTHGKLQFKISHIGKFAFIGVDDLFLHPLCRLQNKINYK